MKPSNLIKIGIIATTLGLPLSAHASTGDSYFNENSQKLNITNKSTVKFEKGETIKPNVTLLPNQEMLTLGIEGGTLSLQVPVTYGRVTTPVALTDTVTEVAIPFDNELIISDTRATQEGWNLAVSATRFSEVPKVGGKEPKGGWYKLPVGSVKLKSAPTVTSLSNTFEAEAPYIVPVDSTIGLEIDSSPVVVISAYKEEGQGVWNVKFDTSAITVAISKERLKQDKVNYPNEPTPYQTTITWTLSSGPGN